MGTAPLILSGPVFVTDPVESLDRIEPVPAQVQGLEPGFLLEAIRVVVAAIRKTRVLLRSRTLMCSCSAYACMRLPDA